MFFFFCFLNTPPCNGFLPCTILWGGYRNRKRYQKKYSHEYSREEVEMSWHVMMNMPPWACRNTTESLPDTNEQETSMMNVKPAKVEFIATARPGSAAAESSYQSHFVPASITKLSLPSNSQAGDSRYCRTDCINSDCEAVGVMISLSMTSFVSFQLALIFGTSYRKSHIDLPGGIALFLPSCIMNWI